MKTKKDILQSIARTNKEIADAMDNLATETDLINTGTEPEFPEKLVSVGGLYSVYDQPNGIPTLNGSGLINSDQLPSYVDDAIEGYYYNGAFYSDSSHQYEIVPESGKIYIDITDPDHAQSYRWSGSTYSIIADPREALFDVNFTEPVPGNLNSDKTLAEIEEAVNDGKVVRGFFGNITYYLTSIQHDTNVKFNAAIKNINYNIEGRYLNSAWNWSYNSWDLSNIKPDWNATAGADNEILNKPNISSIENNITSLQDNVDDLNNCEFPGGWRTPTKDEWDYLINTRSASTVSGVSNARYTKAQVNSINGLILIPDIFTLPSGITMTNINTSSSAFDRNTYTTSQWEILENAGCIFMPTAGHMGGPRFLNPEWGQYWTSSHQILTNSFSLFFNGSTVNVSYSSNNNGSSIRLIKDNNTNGLFSINDNRKCTIAKSNLQFHCLNKEWRFAQNAFDFIGEDNSNKAENYNGWIDLFGFGTSGWNSGATAYQPWSTNELNADYIDHDLTGDYANADWGVYNIKKQLQPVAFTGDYNDLENKPTIPDGLPLLRLIHDPNQQSYFLIDDPLGFDLLDSMLNVQIILELDNKRSVGFINKNGYSYNISSLYCDSLNVFITRYTGFPSDGYISNQGTNNITYSIANAKSTTAFNQLKNQNKLEYWTTYYIIDTKKLYFAISGNNFIELPSSIYAKAQDISNTDLATAISGSTLVPYQYYYETTNAKFLMATSTNTLVEIPTTPYTP